MLNWDDGADADGGSGGWRRTAAAMVTTVSMVKVHSRNNGEATPSSQLKPRVPPSLLTSSAMRWLKLAEFAYPPPSPPPPSGKWCETNEYEPEPEKKLQINDARWSRLHHSRFCQMCNTIWRKCAVFAVY